MRRCTVRLLFKVRGDQLPPLGASETSVSLRDVDALDDQESVGNSGMNDSEAVAMADDLIRHYTQKFNLNCKSGAKSKEEKRPEESSVVSERTVGDTSSNARDTSRSPAILSKSTDNSESKSRNCPHRHQKRWYVSSDSNKSPSYSTSLSTISIPPRSTSVPLRSRTPSRTKDWGQFGESTGSTQANLQSDHSERRSRPKPRPKRRN